MILHPLAGRGELADRRVRRGRGGVAAGAVDCVFEVEHALLRDAHKAAGLLDTGEHVLHHGAALVQHQLRHDPLGRKSLHDAHGPHAVDLLLTGEGEEVAVLVNSLGATTLLELSVVYRRLEQLLKEDGVKIHDSELHNYVTCQEMGGFSITLMRLDDELKSYYDLPCWSPYYSKKETR